MAAVEGYLHFAVTDSGIGIPADKLDTIFEKFSQADSSTTRRYGGTGLGLAITRELVELMEGELWVESQAGVGSRFSFSLPIQAGSEIDLPAPDPVAAPTAVAQPMSARVLLAEDNTVNAMVARRMLEQLGCSVTVASDGRHARDLFDGSSFDLVLMDVQMPVMGGLEATRASETRSWLPVPRAVTGKLCCAFPVTMG